MLLHELDLPLVLLPQGLVLLMGACVRLPCRETHVRVVVYSVHAIWQDFLEAGEVHRVCVAIQPQYVFLIDLSDCFLGP